MMLQKPQQTNMTVLHVTMLLNVLRSKTIDVCEKYFNYKALLQADGHTQVHEFMLDVNIGTL